MFSGVVLTQALGFLATQVQVLVFKSLRSVLGSGNAVC